MNQLKTKSKVVLSLIFAFVMGVSVLGTMLFLNSKIEKVSYSSVSAEQTENGNSEIYEYWEDVQNAEAEPGHHEPDSTHVYIWNEAGLAWFMGQMNANTTYRSANVWLLNDLDLSSKVWTPIGKDSSHYFAGTFDGLGHKIYGLTINKTVVTAGSMGIGLFGYLSGTVQNLLLEGTNIDVSATAKDNNFAGGIAGNIYGNSNIINCGSTGFVYAKHSAGGLVGYISNGTVNIKNSFSYASVTSSSYAGGIVGQKNGGSLTFDRCFYNGTISGTGKYGMVGTGSATITDCYSVGVSKLATDVDSPKKNNNSAWANVDSAVLKGVNISGIGSNSVLKGVGNIYVETSVITYPSTSATKTGYYLKNTVSGDIGYDGTVVKDSGIVAGSNNNFSAVKLERVNHSGDVNTNTSIIDDTVFWQHVNEGSNSITSQLKNADAYKTSGSKVTFVGSDLYNISKSAASLNGTKVTSVPIASGASSTGNYEVKMPNFGCYYKLTAYERGAWKKASLSFLKFKNVTESTPSGTATLTGSVALVKTYKDWSNNVISEPSNGMGNFTNISSKDVYVPYGEKYTVKFTGGTDYNYLNKYSYGKAVNLNDDSKSYTLDQSYESGEIKQDSTETYYFDNIQIVTLDLNADSYSSYKTIVGSTNVPYFVGSTYAETTKTGAIKIRVLANSNFSDTAFCETDSSGNNLVAKSSGSFASILSSGYYTASSGCVPFWMTFRCTGFKDNNGTSWMTSSASEDDIETKLKLASSTKWSKTTPGKNGEAGSFYAQWTYINNSNINVSIQDTDGNVFADKTHSYEDGTRRWLDYLAKTEDESSAYSYNVPTVSIVRANGTKETSDFKIFASNIGTGLVSKSHEGNVVFQVLSKAGYKISAIKIIPSYGDAKVISTQNVISYTSFTYAYNGSGVSVNNRYKLEKDGDTIVFSLDHLMYLTDVNFIIEPKEYSNLELVSSLGQENGDKPAKAIATPAGQSAMTEGVFNNAYVYTFSSKFGSYTDFVITIQDGYSFSDAMSVSGSTVLLIDSSNHIITDVTPGTIVKFESVTYKNASGSSVEDRTKAKTLTFRFKIIGFQRSIAKIRLVVPVQRNSVNLTFVVDNIDTSSLTGDKFTLTGASGHYDDDNKKWINWANSNTELSGNRATINNTIKTYWKNGKFNLNISAISYATIESYIIKVDGSLITTDTLSDYLGINFGGSGIAADKKSLALELTNNMIVKAGISNIEVVVNIAVEENNFKIYKIFNSETKDTPDESLLLTWNSTLSVEYNGTNHSFTLIFTDPNKSTNSKTIVYDGVYDSEFSLAEDNIKEIRICINGTGNNNKILILTYNSKTKTFTTDGSILTKFGGTEQEGRQYFRKDGSGNYIPNDVYVDFVPRETNIKIYKLMLGQDNRVTNTDFTTIPATIDPSCNNKSVFINQLVEVSANSVIGYDFVGYKLVTSDASDFGYTKGEVVSVINLYSTNANCTIDISQATPYKAYTYVVLLYRTRVYTLTFDVGSQKDAIDNHEISKSLSSSASLTWEYGTDLKLTQFPYVNVTNGDMYDFVNWTCPSFGSGFKLTYNKGNELEPFTQTGTSKLSEEIVDKKINFVASYAEKTVNYQFVNEAGQVQTGLGNGIVTYGNNNYSIYTAKLSTKKIGYEQIGWAYDGITYISFIDPQMGNQYTLKDGVYVKVWDKKVSSMVQLQPVFRAVTIDNLVFSAGEGTFGSAKQYTGSVTFGQNNYTSEALSKIPTYTQAGATFEFAGYYIAYVGNTEYKVYPQDLANSSVYDQTIYEASIITFTACYNLVAVNYRTNFENWVYDGTYHDIKVISDCANNSISYTYEWKKSGSSTVITSYTENNGKTSLIKLKNVLESGTYSVKIVATYPTTLTSSTTVEKTIAVENVKIEKRELYFAQNGVRSDLLTKVFDNTKNISNVYTVMGVQNNESVTMTAKYKDVNVGNNKELDITLSDVNNYYYDESIVGQITKYIVVIQINASAYTYKIPGSDDNKKITLIKGVHYDISTESATYLTTTLSASLTIEICTTQNKVGVYTQTNNKLEVTTFETNPVVIAPNLDYRIEGSFEIKNPDSNSLIVNMQVVCEDGASVDIATLSKLTLVSPTNSVDPTLTVEVLSENNTAIVHSKSYFANKQVVFDVDLLNENYWIESVKVNSQSQSILNGKRVTYTILDTSPATINIVVYITTLNNITFNYNLALGETVEDMVASTKFAKGQTIQASINTYGAVLPTVTRPGWIFNGWQVGAIDISLDTVWRSGDATLVANYTLAPLQVEQVVNESKQEPMISEYSTYYNGQNHTVKYSVVNTNGKSITYTYKWTNLDTNIVLSNSTDTLIVKNVSQSGNYKLDILATSGTQSQSVSYIIKVVISPVNVFENAYLITKSYDKTNVAGPVTIVTCGDELNIVGAYQSANAGSRISTDLSKWKVNGSPASTFTNYVFNFSALSDRSVITPRDVEILIGSLTKEYDGAVYEIVNNFSDSVVSFGYTITTTSADVGTYTHSAGKLNVTITGDSIDNFNITILGSVTINPAVITGINYTGDKQVVYDGFSHAINPVVPSYVKVLQVIYTKAGESISINLADNHGGEDLDCGVVDAGTYSVRFTIESTSNYTLGASTTSSLTISKRTIFVDSSSVYSKVYDGTTNVVETITPNIWAEYGTVALSSVVKADAMPELLYSYENANACQTSTEIKRIFVTLANDDNYILSELYSTLSGRITKRAVNVTVNATKIYDAQSFVASSSDLVFSDALATEQGASGSVKFVDIVNAGSYKPSYNNGQIDLSSLMINSRKATENYELTFVDSGSNLVVNKATVTVANTNKVQGVISYVYSGVGVNVEYEFTNSTSEAIPSKENISVTFKSNGSALSEAPIVVGSYTYTLVLDSTNAVNFDLVGDAQDIPFDITPRYIRVNFEKVFTFDNKVFVYSSDEYTTDRIVEVVDNYMDIPEVDTFNWTFTTVKTRTVGGVDITDVGIYHANDASDILCVYSIMNGSIDRTSNYRIYANQDAVIRVNKQQINKSDISVIGSGSVYSAQAQPLTIRVGGYEYTYGDGNDVVTFTNISRTNVLGTEVINSSSDIKYQGTYTFRLTFADYEVVYSGNSQDFEYVISAKEVVASIAQPNKVYDGTVQANAITLSGVYESDQGDVVAYGEYSKASVGNNIAITVTLVTSTSTADTQQKLISYSLKAHNYSGNITPKALTFALISEKSVYYTGNYVEIDASEFNISTINNETITGKILIKKSDAGTYNLSALTNADVVFNLSDNSSNYEYSYSSLSGTLVIQKAEIFVSVTENVKIYNASVQTATVTPKLYEDHGEILDGIKLIDVKYYLDTTLSQEVDPINANNYYIYISIVNNNYILVFEGNIISAHFANEQLQINKREVNVYVESESYTYTGNKAEYNVTNTNTRDLTTGSIGGLVSGHTITAQLLTNSANAGKYQIENIIFTSLDDTSKQIYPHSVQILQNGSDVTSNYTISYTALMYIVIALGEVDSSAIQDIVYKASNVTASNSFFVKFGFETQQYTILYGQTLDVGSNGYKATLEGLKILGGVTVSEAVDIGNYEVSLRIYNTIDPNLNIDPISVSFNIIQKAIQNISYTTDKAYDGTSYIVGEITSSDICVNDLDYVKINGYYDNNGIRVTNVGSYKVVFELASKVAGNEKYSNYYIEEKAYTGKITKQALNLQISSAISIYYTGTNYTIPVSSFVAYKSGTSIVASEVIGSLTGNFIVKQVNAGSYNLSSLYPDNVIQNVNAVSGSSVLQNYEIVSLSGEYTILPCEVSVNVSNRSVEYNAEAQQATFTYQAVTNKGSILESERADLVVAMYNGSETLPINAGNYALSMKINNNYSNNYRLVETNYGNFEITKKDISISIENNYEATFVDETIKYYISAKNINGIIAGHEAVGYFETNDKEVGLYTYGDATNGITFASSAFDILESGVSVKANYNITGYAGSIKIVGISVGVLDTAHIDSLVYSATNYATTGDIYVIAKFDVGATEKTVKFVLNDSTNPNGILSGPTDITNAGKYTIYLTIHSTTTDNEPISFTILQKDITVASFTHDKEFDGNVNVLEPITSNDICVIDRDDAVLHATYDSADKGTDKPISFTITGSKSANYNIVPLAGLYTGNITAKAITIAYTYLADIYYTGSPFDIQKSGFDIKGVDQSGQEIDISSSASGYVTFNMLPAGTYNLSEQLSNIDLTHLSVASNYTVVGVTGTLVINKAVLSVSVADLTTTYNGAVQTPTISCAIDSGKGYLADSSSALEVMYKNLAGNDISEPVDADEYTINIKVVDSANYVVNYGGELVSEFNYSSKFVIEKKEISILVNGIKYFDYSGSKAVYVLVNADVTGLVSGHNIDGTLTTSDKLGGTYTYIASPTSTDKYLTDDIKVKSGSQNVTDNYVVTSITAEIHIVSKLANAFVYEKEYVYDKTVKVITISLEIDDEIKEFTLGASSEICTLSEFKYNGNTYPASEFVVKNVGEYSFKAVVSTNDNTLTETIVFSVTPLVINAISYQENKTYDGTTAIIGTISAPQIKSGDNVTIEAVYDSADIGNRSVIATLSGSDAYNYTIDPSLSLGGKINARQITLSIASGVTYVFSNTNPSILATDISISSGTLASGQVLGGYIKLNKVDAGSHNFAVENIDASTLTIIALGENVIANYDITYSGNIQITPRVVTLTVPATGFDLEYNGQVKDIKDLLQSDIIDQDNLPALANSALVVSYNKTPLDAANDYVATVSSNSANFTFTFGGSTTTTFEIAKKALQLDVGDNEVIYNPTSDFATNILPDNLVGLVSGQAVQGVYKVSQVGANAGVYKFDNNNPRLIIEGLQIVVNGENILNKNYDFAEEKLGQLTIIAKQLSVNDVWLKTTESVYSAGSAVSKIVICFVDSNGVTQSITSTDSTYGTFVVTEGDIIDAGQYHIVPTINNYNLDSAIDLTYTIKPKQIYSISCSKDKEYDGDSVVYNSSGTSNLYSGNILMPDADKVFINANYCDANGNPTIDIGRHQIIFAKIGDATKCANYEINVSEVYGNINPKSITLTCTNVQFVYNPTGIYKFDIDNAMFNGLLGSDIASGYIAVSKVDYVGAVDITDIDLSNIQIKNGSKSVEGNYNITFVGSVQIQKALIEVDFAGIENSYVYSKNPVAIQPQIQVKDDALATLPEITLSYLDLTNNFVLANAPKDVGNYRAVFELGSQFYEFDTANTFDFAITEYNFELTADDIPVDSFTKSYNEQDPSLVFDINSPLSEVIVVTFTRVAGEAIGGYDVSIKSYDNSNYQLSLASGVGTKLFKILKAGILNVTILNTAKNIALLQKEYDNLPIDVVDISILDYEANDEVVTGTLTFGNGTTQVGTYNLASYTLETENYGEVKVVCELTFAIIQKAIKVVAVNASKTYDASTLFVGDFEIRDIHDNVLSGYPLTISGAYSQAQVGENIKITLSYSNDSVDNYDITDLAYGSITKRSVTVTPNQDQFIVYGTADYLIAYSVQDNGLNEFFGNLQNEIAGNLEIRLKAGKSKYIVGEYPIYSNLTAENLEISFTSDVTFEITPKELMVSSQERISKIYDGTTAVLQQLQVTGLIDGDDVSVTANYEDAIVGTNKAVIFTLSGVDKDNYFANNTDGDITEKFVYVVYEYVQQDMINEDLIKNNLTAQDRLVYSQTVAYSIGELPYPTHEGYEFAGWYLGSNYSVLISNETVIDENIWDVDTDEMTVYAKWTIKSFMLNIHVMTRQNGLYKENNVGGTHADISGLYDYYQVVSLQGCANANNGYTFIGYSLEPELLPDDSYLSSGIRILAKENNLYAKFDPLMIEIVLDANGGLFERSGEWIFDEYNTIARVVVEYNNVLGQNMPRATKDGYEQVYTSWIGEDETIYNPTIDTIISDVWDYSAQLILKADYQAKSYYLILNAGGGFFENYSSDWTKVDVDLEQRAITISKQVTFNEAVGEIVMPQRLGYTFDCWSIENFDANYVWNFTNNEVVTAQWTEDSHTISISSTHGYIDVKVYGMGGDVLIISEKVVSGSTVEVTALTTNIVVLQVVADQGYTFDKWSSTLAQFDQSQELMIMPTNFYDDYTFEALYTANLNNITIVANPNEYGYVYSSSESTQGVGHVVIEARTGESLDIVAVPNEGYVVTNWVVNSRFDYELSGKPTDLQRTLSNFVSDLTILVVFEPKENNITIVTDAIKGELYIDNIVRNSNYVAVAKTEDALIFTIAAKHGYKVDMSLSSWTFDTLSSNKGQFEISGDEYFATVTLTGFTADGKIVVPFVKDSFTITVVSVTKDLDYIIDNYDEIVNLVQDSVPSVLNSGDTFTGEYESTVTLSVNQVVPGYTFSDWSLENDRMHLILAENGLISRDEDGTIQIAILDSITIYVVYEIKTYVVKYSVNDTVRGSLAYGEFTGLESYQVSVKYGYNAPEILASTDETYYNFVEWVIVGDGENTRVTTDKLLIVTNVTQDSEYVAMFVGKPLQFTVVLELNEEDVFTDGEIDFAELEYNQPATSPTEIISTFSPTNNVITYIFKTYTGEDVSFEIIEKMGYEISGMLVDPRVVFTRTGTTIELSRINISTKITVKIKAQVHEVSFKITGKQDGADIFPQSPYNAITQQELSADKKTLTLYVKTGGDANSMLYTYFGYKLINNTIYTIDPLINNASAASAITFYNGGITNVVKDEEIVIEIEIVKYYVTFNLNDGSGVSYSSVVGYNRTDFDPVIPENISAPIRAKYIFQGYNTMDDASGVTYMFGPEGIYSMVYEGDTAVESKGFKGSLNITPSTRDGIDYECTLYGEWALETHEIKVVFVPNFAVNESQIVYTSMFPNVLGRHLIRDGVNIIGIAYEPDALVAINSPAVLSGFDYYGWSYTGNLTDRTQINVGAYNEIMGEEEILVYLYYTIRVDAVAQAGGTASISNKNVLYGETTTISCNVNPGYDFGYWMQNTTKIDDSQVSMQVIVTAPTTYYAVFIGKPVEVRFDTNEYAKLRVGEDTVSDVYRVGDVIKIDVYDITYGYAQVSWSGEYTGQIDTSSYYTITPEDQIRGYVRFGVVMEPRKVSVQFVIEDRIGGTFLYGGQELVNVTKEFTYDQMLSFAINIQDRYELVKVTLNDVEINASTTDLVINQSNGFTVDATNVLKAKFKQMLWVEVWEMFTGQGTESDPYVIQNENQLAAMAYLINNNIESDGTIPYAQGYYVVKRNMNLAQRFWQPIGTRENPFDGTFDLSDYKVIELTLDQIYTVTNLEGLFGYITENANFITKAKNYTTAIVIISVSSALVLGVVATIIIIVVVKRRRMKKLQVNSSISTDNMKGIEKDENE